MEPLSLFLTPISTILRKFVKLECKNCIFILIVNLNCWKLEIRSWIIFSILWGAAVSQEVWDNLLEGKFKQSSKQQLIFPKNACPSFPESHGQYYRMWGTPFSYLHLYGEALTSSPWKQLLFRITTKVFVLSNLMWNGDNRNC